VAALTIFQTGTFAAGAKLAAILFAVFGYGLAKIKLALALVIGTDFIRHINYLLAVNRRQLSCQRRSVGTVGAMCHL
jgi:hypothetical protein